MPRSNRTRCLAAVHVAASAAVALLLATGPARGSDKEDRGLLVGWAQADITPDRPVPLAGQMRTRITKSVGDPVTCTALALESRRGEESLGQTIMVSCDIVSITPQLVDAVAASHERLVAACPGIDPDAIILNATHSHSAPALKDDKFDLPPGTMTGAEYTAFAAERIVAAVIEAWGKRAPGRVGWGFTHAVLAHNRRVVSFDPATGRAVPGRTVMYGPTATATFDALEGPADTAVAVVAFWGGDDALTGLIVNVPCPSQVSEQSEEISADFWHEARAGLRAALGGGIFVLPQCAAAAGSVPRSLVRTAAEEEMRRRRGLSQREEIARRLVAAVADVIEPAHREAVADPVLAHVARSIDLPERIITTAERDRCLADAAAAPADRPGKARWHRAVAARYDRQQERIAAGVAPTLPVRVQAVRLGDVAFVTNSFELFEDYGLRIQARSPALLTCVVQLAGRGTPGTYLPTARAVEGGGYSATVESNYVGPEGGRMLVDESVALLHELWASEAAESRAPTVTATP